MRPAKCALVRAAAQDFAGFYADEIEFLRHILLKAPTRRELNRILARCRAEFKPPAVVRMSIDIDPVDMM